jgi:hypothetical protein
VEGCDFIYTDVWVSMGEPESVWADRIALLSPFTVTQEVMDLTGNPHAKFLHCLPAFHNRDTKTGEKTFQTYGIDCMEVTDEVFESPASVVFDQAENRLHSIKAVLVATIGACDAHRRGPGRQCPSETRRADDGEAQHTNVRIAPPPGRSGARSPDHRGAWQRPAGRADGAALCRLCARQPLAAGYPGRRDRRHDRLSDRAGTDERPAQRAPIAPRC